MRQRTRGSGREGGKAQNKTCLSVQTDSCSDTLEEPYTRLSAFQHLAVMVLLFLTYLSILYFFLKHFPHLSDSDRQLLKEAMPQSVAQIREKLSDLHNLKTVYGVLEHYTGAHSCAVVAAISGLYLFYQIFPLFLFWAPGSGTALSILTGALFGFWRGVVIVCILATLGPALCFALFSFTGKPVVSFFFQAKLKQLQRQTALATQKGEMVLYIAVLRLTPLFPNFFINLASPLLGVPFREFIAGTFLGLVPNTIILVLMGTSLMELNSLGATLTSGLLVSLLGVLLILPKLTSYFYSKWKRT